AVFDLEIAALNPAERGERRLEDGDSRSGVGVFDADRADTPHSGRGLGHRDGRQGSGAEKRDQLAAPHSRISSARANTKGGIARPSSFEILRLMISSNRVGRSIGNSAGLAPLRILSTSTAARLKFS